MTNDDFYNSNRRSTSAAGGFRLGFGFGLNVGRGGGAGDPSNGGISAYTNNNYNNNNVYGGNYNNIYATGDNNDWDSHIAYGVPGNGTPSMTSQSKSNRYGRYSGNRDVNNNPDFVTM